MKKSLFIMALGAIALTSCSQDEIIEVKQDAIGFSVATENASRADATTATSLVDFVVYANENSGDPTTDLRYITGITATTGGAGGGTGSFKLASTYYWPIKPLDFYCISPAAPVGSATPEVNRISVSDNIPSISEYTVGSAHSEDLLYSVALGLKRGGDVGTAGCKVAVGSDGVAAINFRHALAMVQFKFASASAYDLDVTVSKIKLVNVAQTGAYALPSVATLGTDFDNDETHGDWTIASDAYTETYTWTESHTATVATASTAGTTYFILPQAVAAATPTVVDVANGETWEGAFFEISCVLKKDDVTVYKGEVAIPVAATYYTWEEGHKYVYTFTFGQGGGYYPGSNEPAIVPISFDITVDDMKDAAPAPEVPVEVAP